jgi:peptidoglycan/LPS O-acetylase OafA/YrhL
MTQTSDISAPDRLHALDATRAVALLAGVAFHAAWSFTIVPSGAPVADVSSLIGFDWLCFTIHAFRLPLFFIIAGFFARLIYTRKGLRGFVRHRALRIAVPLVAGWLLLHPLVVLSWNIGANASGANLAPFTPDLQLKMMIGQGLMFVAPSRGGLFELNHLWFLYYLLWLYALLLGTRYIALRAKPVWPARADKFVSSLVRGGGAVPGLALATGLFLWRMDGWAGVDTPDDTLIPALPPLLFYFGCAGFGWMLHRQPALIARFGLRWRGFAAAGLALSFILFGAFHALSVQGVTLGASGSMYPALWPTQVTDWPRFIATLKSYARPDASPERANFWKHVPDWDRAPMLALPENPSASVQIGLCRNLSRLLEKPGLFGPAQGESQALLENRRIFEKLFAGSVRGDPRLLPWYEPVKLGYSFGYGLLMWLLVYATVGFFQDRFNAPSPALRYIADSSYWVYLIHLPIVLALEGCLYAWPAPGLLKFTVIMALTFAAAFGSYHYLVRPTVIGLILNGKRYPRPESALDTARALS